MNWYLVTITTSKLKGKGRKVYATDEKHAIIAALEPIPAALKPMAHATKITFNVGDKMPVGV